MPPLEKSDTEWKSYEMFMASSSPQILFATIRLAGEKVTICDKSEVIADGFRMPSPSEYERIVDAVISCVNMTEEEARANKDFAMSCLHEKWERGEDDNRRICVRCRFNVTKGDRLCI